MCRVVLLTLILLVGSAISTEVSKCSNGDPFPLSVEVEGCAQQPCDVVKGTTAVMDVHFVGTKDNISNVTAKVKATTMGLTVPYDLPEDVADVCGNLLYGAQCPIDKTEDVVYKFNFYVDNSYPQISVKVEVSLVDDFGDTIACFACNIKVKKGNSGGRSALLEIE